MPKNLIQISPNQSSRFFVKPRLIVAHDTEGGNVKGTRDLYGTAAWFGLRSTRASAHRVGDAEGNQIMCVPDSRKAWHASWVNSWSLGYEQVAHASWSKDNWVDFFHLGLYRFAAQIATWSHEYDIPIQIAPHGWSKGVTTHVRVSGRGGHWDCGPNYPLLYVVNWARLVKERRKVHPRRDVVREYDEKVRKVQRTYRPGRVNTQPW